MRHVEFVVMKKNVILMIILLPRVDYAVDVVVVPHCYYSYSDSYYYRDSQVEILPPHQQQQEGTTNILVFEVLPLLARFVWTDLAMPQQYQSLTPPLLDLLDLPKTS